MAQLNRRITADVIEANEFPELSQRFNVMGVPKTVINATQELVGAQPEARLLAAIRAATARIVGQEDPSAATSPTDKGHPT
jgi:predicted DsbA family dithiol-disulfide isomerase